MGMFFGYSSVRSVFFKPVTFLKYWGFREGEGEGEGEGKGKFEVL